MAIPSSGDVGWDTLLNPPVQAGQEKPYIHTNSWGIGPNGSYTSQVKTLDSHLFGNQNLTVLFSAGNNEAPDMLTGRVPGHEQNLNRILERSLREEAIAKNVIAVGSSESQRPREKFSWNASYQKRH